MNNFTLLTAAIILLVAAFLIIRKNKHCQIQFEMADVSKSMIQNEQMKNYSFLSGMRADSYFPSFLVDKCENILIELCIKIENERPQDLKQLYKLTHNATNKINSLEDEFFENDSEIETAAREIIAMDFEVIAKAYSFENADIETLIATRNW
ncbi:DUF5713 family protein [Carboxylicivirga linearis]|uniref:Uncharacterized protein n=1 Tax=Carboxylicivirga linearis TaxID=1628157 RepID=A0ABS5K1K9_9BACT|nr:DUF5713 family protein [Carboxylicivirga linearis]MBS2101057.1 hypothetical protein [Carboxylicivirga linearis]